MRHIAGATAPPTDDYDADIVILALDRAEETLAAIRSALDATGISRHVTILDQGSSAATLARLAAAVAGRADATLLAADRNYGVAGGRNRVTAFGHGRVIVGLDNDAEFASVTTAAGMVSALDTAPDLAAIGCRILRPDGGGDDLSSWGYPRALLLHAGDIFGSVTFVGAGHAIRRQAWDQAGGYDDALFFCWEEYDFCLRAIALGWRVQYRGDLAVCHKVSAERRVGWSGSRWFHFVRNRLYIGRKQAASPMRLAPRAAGYVLQGLRNGFLLTTLRAIQAARSMPVDRPYAPQAAATRAYLQRHDIVWRGSWPTRLRNDVFRALP